MSMIKSVPPLIPGSTNFDTYEVKIMKTNALLADIITNGTITLENGRLTGLTEPVNNQDAANKQYIDGFLSNIETAVQFNDNGIFGSSLDFTFDDSTKIVTIDGIITDGTASLTDGILSNIVDPPIGGINAQIAIPKKYVDQFDKIVTSKTIVAATDITYSGQEIVNGIIYRNPVNLGLISPYSDYMPTASDIIANMTGKSASFYIKNITNDNNVFINLKENTGVSFMKNSENPSSITIPKDYVLSGKILNVDSYRLSTWNNCIVPSANAWQSATWSDEESLFVAVASSGVLNRVMTSSDGITWFTQTTPVDNSWKDVIWAPELSLFVAVSDSDSGTLNMVMTSPNGVNWTIRATPNSNRYNGIAWSPSLNLLVAVGDNGAPLKRAMTSSNGINWFSQTTPNGSYFAVAWSPELSIFCAVSTTGVSMISSNGISWGSSFPMNSNAHRSIAWSSELRLFCSPGTGLVELSPDGMNWTSYSTVQTHDWCSIVWAPEVSIFLISAATSSSTQAEWSPDGINWRTTALGNSQFCGLSWSGPLNRFVNVSEQGIAKYADALLIPNTVSVITESLTYAPEVSSIYSFRGIEPSANIGGGPSENYLGTVANSLIDTSKIYYPLDDTTYSDGNIILDYALATREGQTTTSITNTSNITISFKGPASNTVFSAEGYVRKGGFRYTIRNGSFQSSITVVASDGFNVDPNSNMIIGPGKDGIFWIYADYNTETVTIYTVGIIDREPFQWTTQTTPNNSFTDVAWGPEIGAELGLFVAVSDSGVGNRAITSPDGINWTAQASIVDNDWQSIAFSPTLAMFAAVSNTGTGDRVMTSLDGINWISQTSAADSAWSEIIWAGGLSKFVAVAGSGANNVMTSGDGVSWSAITSGIDISHVNWSANLGVLVGSGSADMSFSYDGITWTTATGTGDFSSIAWSAGIGKFVAVRNENLSIATDALRPVNISTDGLTWTSSSNVMVSNQWTDIQWSPGLNMFVTVANSGSDDKAGTILDNNRSEISFNGTEWIAVRTPVNNKWESLTWSPELNIFVAVASTGNNDRVMTGMLI